VPDDIVARLLQLQGDPATSFSDSEIRTNLLGYVVGGIPTISKAADLALDELLNRPAELAGAQQAARDGNLDLVAAYVFEALRFNPHNPGLIRVCASDYVLGRGTSYETTIPAGMVTLAATQSAMFDGDAVPNPDSFQLDRPWEQYLHFGSGQHSCGGEHVARTTIPRIAAALLRRRNLRRAPGAAGSLAWEGPFPSGMTLEFDPE
jgi:cytochrome P450